MQIHNVSIGANPPYDINVVIEVPMGADPIKYDIDKDSGALVVDRFMFTAMTYPCNYGFVPHTLSDDGNPIDVLCQGIYPLQPNSVINTRPVGVLIMEDEKGLDEKILAVPSRKITDQYDDVNSFKDVNEAMRARIAHFFEHYKDLEKKKWVRVVGWRDETIARQIIRESIDRYSARAA